MRPPHHRYSSPGYSLQTMLVAFPFVCFTLTLATDLAFWGSANLMWQNFSAWLLFAGLVVGGIAVVTGILGLLFLSHDRDRSTVWPYAVGGLIVLILALFNSFVHAGDGWTAVVPNGLILSAITVVLMLATAWIGRVVAHRHAAHIEGVRTYG
ncbi:DUF2231 domain-containing protein [Mangrovicella endophytica]|uniref:DUF2231 domain-containing protein n=1 Tax=Mangrovicella endophytica TaxID=2066697 RepID=UPI000C9E9FAE|nr:DUF2231 domain-containing protein [Mangrovicella endophytica]